jgi:hypothetical protein
MLKKFTKILKAQHRTAQHSTAQHSTAQQGRCIPMAMAANITASEVERRINPTEI